MGSLPASTLARPSFEAAFGERAFLSAMLRFEAALARAQADEGVIPAASAVAIGEACAHLRVDAAAFIAEGKRNATLAVPLARLLKEDVARRDAAAAKHVHLGATSQDVLDTAMALCLQACLDEADRGIEACIRGLAAKAREHRATPMMGRTLLQPAVPITAGLKLARWAAALARDRERLAEAAAEGLAVQLGGPVGALDGMGGKGPAVRHRMALALGLADRPSWQAHRNDWLALLNGMALVVVTAGKIARDVSLLAQPEVGEMQEAPPSEDAGRSSAMPHKRNPVLCAHALAAATRIPGLVATALAGAVAEHERALGGWQAELGVVPDIAAALGTALDFLEPLGASLVVDAGRMRDNARVAGEPAPDLVRAADEALAPLAAYLS